MSAWTFEPDVEVKTDDTKNEEVLDLDAMQYTLTYGIHKGERFAEIMKTQSGRSYLTWLKAQPNTNPEYEGAHEKRISRITRCFAIYDKWLQSQQPPSQVPTAAAVNIRRPRAGPH